MANVYSLSIEGIHNAEVALERAARKIASGRISDFPFPETADTVDISSSGRSAASAAESGPVDYAAEIVAIKQAETTLKANLRTFVSQRDLDREALNLYA